MSHFSTMLLYRTLLINASSLSHLFRDVSWKELKSLIAYLFLSFFFFFCLFAFSRAAPAAYGGSQARGVIRAVATGLHQSHSNMGSEPRLWSTPQLMAMLDPLTHWARPGIEAATSWFVNHGSDSLTTAPRRELPFFLLNYGSFLMKAWGYAPGKQKK